MALVNTVLKVAAAATQTNPLDLVTGRAPLDFAAAIALGSGTGANQADMIWSDTRTLAASATEDLDLAGVLVGAFGNTLTFARIKGLIVRAAGANANTVVVGGAASNGFVGWVADSTDKVNVRPGGVLGLFAPDATGYPVTAGTGDLLRIGNGGAGTAVTYDIVVIGASA
ncbi:hypothetical protein ACFC58_36245 [Kitasatospora purpeofusca]|uniref:hypothetical protein n=1 Tax=Kitasatospora purpeofusca TaxID=67352 RepID=UPI0035D8F67E